MNDLSLRGTYDKELRFRAGDEYLKAKVREAVIK